MIQERTSWWSRNTPAVSLALALSLPVLCAAQATPPAPAVPTNPRAAADDPRIGLKGGLYDAGEAASGLERLTSLPKPPAFAPGDATMPPAPAPPPAAAAPAPPP